ncbi:inter-alpha-trypsin inhibitor heavy chain H4 [Peromyscus californicus insignis]|uniref:inter-alpha-trypsin inhibitor heavy chain H4 n=1 Tax=Peromyscus californicus insignis TaxID=564181 RepID=UPI0022A78D91|nr:inter-alpha-trypsin inhibitor heavy chain H4 [Peromyscus californicus insignis]
MKSPASGHMWSIVSVLPSLLAVLQTTTATKNGIDIYSLTVDSRVSSRFAHTVVTSRVVNRASDAQEATFQIELPRKAFITNFSMVIDGETYPGIVQDKAAAQEQYSAAVARGESAGLVKTTGRQTEQFQVSVTVAPNAKITFELVYQELLRRQLGTYELLLKIKPQQLVRHLQMDIHIFEPQGISFLETESTFMTQELADALTTSQNKTKAHVRFKPTLSQQQNSQHEQDTILDGNFIVRYDVDRSVSGGSIQIENGYFVHHFAPEDLPTMPKNVVFVIDKSGSMSGKKIQQTREALIKILNDLSPKDKFNLIVFNEEITQWMPSLLEASKENLKEATIYASKIDALGGTNINDAMLMAVRLLDTSNQAELLPSGSVSLIILLTDGEPTSGETNPATIQKNVHEAINNKYSVFCLGFGFDVHYPFLEKLAQDNGGLARRIYEDSDSALQLQDFYHEVANPQLLAVTFEYPSDAVEVVTQDRFRHHFKGSEMVVAGKLQDQGPDVLSAKITGQMHMQNITFQTEASVAQKEEEFQSPKYIFHNFMERLWALLTINQQLEQRSSASGDELKALESQALNLSLTYNFVTPLTHMVVTKPEGQEQFQVAEKPVEADNGRRNVFLGASKVPVVSSQAVLRSMDKDKESATPDEAPPPAHLQAPAVILPLPGSSEGQLCVDITRSHVPMKLFIDPGQGLLVAGVYENGIFSWISVRIQEPPLFVEATPKHLVVTRDRKNTAYKWKQTLYSALPGLKITMDKTGLLQFSGPDRVNIALLPVDNPQDGLILLVNDTQHFSNSTDGELGQFYQTIIWDPPGGPDNTVRTLRVQGTEYSATRQLKLKYPETEISCWTVKI